MTDIKQRTCMLIAGRVDLTLSMSGTTVLEIDPNFDLDVGGRTLIHEVS